MGGQVSGQEEAKVQEWEGNFRWVMGCRRGRARFRRRVSEVQEGESEVEESERGWASAWNGQRRSKEKKGRQCGGGAGYSRRGGLQEE